MGYEGVHGLLRKGTIPTIKLSELLSFLQSPTQTAGCLADSFFYNADVY